MTKQMFIKPEPTSNITTKVEIDVEKVEKFLKDLYKIFPNAEVGETPIPITYKSFIEPIKK